jgi:hypothetical protein
VELAGKPQGKLLQPFTKKTKTTVHRFITHEPMPRFKSFTSEGILPIGGADNVKQYNKLSTTPGTKEYMEAQNRKSEIDSIRQGQWQADAESYLKASMGDSTSAVKARQLLADFGEKYDTTFNLPNTVDSISNKLKNFSLSDSVSDVKNNLTTQLSNQVIESITGNDAVQLFKDNVFVNTAGQLYSLKGGGADLGQVLNSVQGITGNLNIGNIGSIANDISTVTNVYKNVLAGNITSVTQLSSIANKAKGFFSSQGPAGKYPSGFSSLTKSIGSYGASAAKAIGGFFSGFKFSDVRLKEDVQLVGKSPTGINIYSFKYKQSAGTYEGVMAQEVPWARQMTDTGFYMVDYSKVDVEFRRVN